MDFKTSALDDSNPLQVWILNPNKEALYDKRDLNHAKFSVTTHTSGEYQF